MTRVFSSSDAYLVPVDLLIAESELAHARQVAGSSSRLSQAKYDAARAECETLAARVEHIKAALSAIAAGTLTK